MSVSYQQENDIKEVLFTSAWISQRVGELGYEISCSFGNKTITAVSLLNGAVPFTADLVRSISNPLTQNFIKASSYRGGTTSNKLVVDGLSDADFYDKHILLIDDILDTGKTLSAVYKKIEKQKPATIHSVVLLNKQRKRNISFVPDWWAFDVKDEFVVGYGLDYKELYRNLDYIGVLKESIYDKA